MRFFSFLSYISVARAMDILTSASPELRKCLIAANIKNVSTLGNFDFEDLSDIISASIDTDLELELNGLWMSAVAECNREVAAIAKDGLPRDPSCVSFQSPLPSDPAAKPRTRGSSCFNLTGLGDTQIPKRATVLMAPDDLTVTKPTTTLSSSKRQDTLDSLWDLFVLLGAHGSLWVPSRMATESGRTNMKAMLQEEWSDSEAVPSHLTTFNLWMDFAKEEGTDWRVPDVFSIKMFLKSFRPRGATVPLSRLNSLRWLHRYVGLPFESERHSIRKTAAPPAAHVAQQVKPLTPKMRWMFCAMTRSKNVFVKALGFSGHFLYIRFSGLATCSARR